MGKIRTGTLPQCFANRRLIPSLTLRLRPATERFFTPPSDLIHSPATEVQINGLKSTAAFAASRCHTRSWREKLKPENSGPGAQSSAERPNQPDNSDLAASTAVEAGFADGSDDEVEARERLAIEPRAIGHQHLSHRQRKSEPPGATALRHLIGQGLRWRQRSHLRSPRPRHQQLPAAAGPPVAPRLSRDRRVFAHHPAG